jgi:NEDD8-activating enzyme E1 regulatory subunit
MDQQEHGHVPYVAILMSTLSNWRSTHSGNVPTTFQEKAEFRDMVEKGSRDFGMEVNYQEAKREAYLAYGDVQEIPEHVKDIMGRDSVQNLTKGSGSFDILLSALSEFAKTHNGCPPMNGSIPDMTASSTSYIDLQGIYFERSKRELEEFTGIVENRLKELGLPVEYIPLPTISTFAKNVTNLTVVQSRSYHSEVTEPAGEEEREAVQGLVWDPHSDAPVHTPLLWWVGIKSAEEYHRVKGTWPGVGDKGECEKIAVSILRRYGLELEAPGSEDGGLLSPSNLSLVLGEVLRYEGSENHCVGSVTGGVAGQEGVKVITGIYTPVDNTYVFNGIAGVAGVVKG